MAKSTTSVTLGGARFDLASGEIDTGAQRRRLRPQSAQVLAELCEHAGELVTKAHMLDRVWPDTHVTEDSLVQCVSEIRKALRGVDGVTLRTIPKQGYRLEYAAAPAAPADSPPRALMLACLALAAALLLWFGLPRPPAPGPAAAETATPPTIAVLPFRNMSGDPDQAYFSNGLAEDLITDLSRLADVRVVARGASFALDTAALSSQQVAATLRADVLVEGSVRRSGDDLRLSVALVDGNSGVNLWAKRYEGARTDVFAFQDEVSHALLRALSVRLSGDERARLGVRGTRSIEAYDAYLRGRELLNLYTPASNREAVEALRLARRTDPDFALPYAHLSLALSFAVENHWSEQPQRDIGDAFNNAERALALDPALPFAHFAEGRLYTRSFRPDETRALRAYQRAIELDPNYSDAYVFLANTHIFHGRAEQALPLIAEALERNPLPPYWYDLASGMAHYFLHDFAAAREHLLRARDRNPTAPFPYRFLIATYGQLGDPEEADWMAMEYESLGREATVQALLESAAIQDGAYREAFAAGFRLAGLPES